MLKPDLEVIWDMNKKRFIGRNTDPNNGVETKWEVIPLHKVTIRTDTLPIFGLQLFGLQRRIWDNEEEQGLFSNQTRYSIEDGRHPLRKSLDITVHKPMGNRDAHIFLRHLTGGFDFFSAHFSGDDGLFRRLSFQGNQQAGTRPEQQEAIETQSYEECLDELLQISKSRGLTVFLGPVGEMLWEKKNPTAEDIGFAAHLGLLTYTENLSQEQLPSFYEVALEYAAKELDRCFKEDEFVRDNSEVICLALALKTVNQFAEHPNSSIPFPELVKDYFEEAVKSLLGDYYGHIQRAGEFDMDYKVGRDGDISYILSSDGEVSTEGNTKIGGSFRFEEYSYTLRREAANRLQLVIRNILKPKTQTLFEFPETVDIPRIHALVSTDQNTGWEESLNLIPMNYSSQ